MKHARDWSTRNLSVQVALWVFFSAIVLLVGCYQLSASLVDGRFIPSDHDSFYHARRILDAIGAPLTVVQFDPMIHAPEGSWVTWPWAYDAAMAMLATLAMQLHASDPMTALAWVAPCWGLVNTALVIGITRRLRFPLLFQVVALACFATSPLTQLLHRVGMLDHHFVEYSFSSCNPVLGFGFGLGSTPLPRAMGNGTRPSARCSAGFS